MKISGSATLNAPVDQVWAAFNDPAVLVRTLPGCQELREIGPDAYKMTITAGVASIKGTYEGDVALTDQNPPGSFVLKASGTGAPGTVSADVRVLLEETATGGTALSYDADAVVGGAIGGVGQRMLTGVAKKMAGQFFTAVDNDIAGVRVAVPVPAGAVPEAAVVGAPGAPAAPAGAVYAAPAPAARAGFAGRDFLIGTVVGAAIALAGVAVGIVAGRH
ncbi:MAG TPA: carbon monoxide dehydrogenase subunit G [Oryzihumus sp.]|nr:carbon monoxide dehydrogenase subunit G [Oryzihumus sp.]